MLSPLSLPVSSVRAFPFSPPFIQEIQWKYKGEQRVATRSGFLRADGNGGEEADLKMLGGKGLLPVSSALAVGSEPAVSNCLSLTVDGSSV